MSTYETFGHTSDEEDSISKDSFDLTKERNATKSQKYVYTVFKLLCSREFLRALVLGQCLSLLLCGVATFSGLLQEEDVHVPAAQSFVMYCCLCLVFTTQLAYTQGPRNLLRILGSKDSLKYAAIGLADVEANYLVVKAFRYTSVTSVQVLDCFSIVVVLVLSRLLLGIRYRVTHYVGVTVCVAGLGGLVGADVITGQNDGDDDASNAALGDFLVVAGSALYGISNVAQEFVVKSFDKTEFLGMLGTFSTLFSGIQVIVLERNELLKVDFSSYKVVLPWLGYVIFLFLIYTCMSYVIQKTSATVSNISILSSGFYALLVGIFIFNYTFHILYLVSFVLVILGVAIYSFKPTSDGLHQESKSS